MAEKCPTRRAGEREPLTAEILRAQFSYDRETGLFTRFSTGRVAGTIDGKGYVVIKINGVMYKAHRLAWLYEHGEWPPYILDHRNRVRDDNSLDNLRPATESLNMANSSARRAVLKGAHWSKREQRWQAQIRISGTTKWLGYFDSEIAAANAYNQAAKLAFGEFAEDWSRDERSRPRRFQRFACR